MTLPALNPLQAMIQRGGKIEAALARAVIYIPL
jgi:hypothetical protein